ncbi:hypothetical protein [Acidicapsa ligni]|uniref:hypothetical protein n=1 Tax=Acidicapsa ligni TaxID=542300 RepID=UPI0021E0CA89|nr:hypothetical protein [Acidicapsa ligni]
MRAIFANLSANLRYAARQLLRARMYTSITIITLALGVGANTAIFSVVQAVLLQPAGIDDPACRFVPCALYSAQPAQYWGFSARYGRCSVSEPAR